MGGVNHPSRKASRMPNEAWPPSQVTVSSTHSKAWAPGTAPRGSGTGGHGAQGYVAASGSRKAPGARARGAVCGDRGRASRLASGQGLLGTPSLHPSLFLIFFFSLAVRPRRNPGEVCDDCSRLWFTVRKSRFRRTRFKTRPFVKKAPFYVRPRPLNSRPCSLGAR